MESKPGYKTTEFWLSMASMIVGIVYASGVVEEGNKVLGLVASILGALGYTVSRAFVKGQETKRDAVIAASGAANPTKPPSP